MKREGHDKRGPDIGDHHHFFKGRGGRKFLLKERRSKIS